MHPIRSLLLLLCAAWLAVLPAAAFARAKDESPEARGMRGDGRDRHAERGPAARRAAIERREQAVLLAPNDTRALAELGRAYLDAGFTHSAEQTFERVTRQDPADAGAWFGLGQTWKRDWLATLAPASLASAIDCYGNAVRLDPGRTEAWTTLAVLRVEQGDMVGAGTCARRALAADSGQAGASLAGAYLLYHIGRVAQAESLFAVAIARLAPGLAARFRDLTPLVTPAEGENLAGMTPEARGEFARRFWSASDPDPTTRTNEAQVEYWARVAHAVLLFSDSWDPHWDMRAELYVRYGSPQQVAYQPQGHALAQRPDLIDHWYVDLIAGVRRVGDADPMWYPLHLQVWAYPNLGMNVVLTDMAISQHYELPRDAFGDTEPVPDPATMAKNGLVGTAGGRAAFAVLPPGVEPRELQALVSAFEGERGPRLLAHVAAPGTPRQPLVAECVVIDSSEREVARASRTLGVSRCDPGSSRAGDFSFDLPPGRYRVGLAVSDSEGGRGVLRLPHVVEPVTPSVAMSDLVLLCGPLDASPAQGTVRLDPNLFARVGAHEPLLAYFEVYHLRADAAGGTRFEYETTVRPLRADAQPWFRRLFARQPTDEISVRSSEEGVGPTRRQYITVPVQPLPPGAYRLEISVDDRVSGKRSRRSAEFVKSAPATTD